MSSKLLSRFALGRDKINSIDLFMALHSARCWRLRPLIRRITGNMCAISRHWEHDPQAHCKMAFIMSSERVEQVLCEVAEPEDRYVYTKRTQDGTLPPIEERFV